MQQVAITAAYYINLIVKFIFIYHKTPEEFGGFNQT